MGASDGISHCPVEMVKTPSLSVNTSGVSLAARILRDGVDPKIEKKRRGGNGKYQKGISDSCVTMD
jgi:hypothetical protein